MPPKKIAKTSSGKGGPTRTECKAGHQAPGSKPTGKVSKSGPKASKKQAVSKPSPPPSPSAAEMVMRFTPGSGIKCEPSVVEESYLLFVGLTNSSSPMISRVLSVPSAFSFAKLHVVLQVAFGWANCRMHTFEYRGERLYRMYTHPEDSFDGSGTAEADITLKDVWGKEELKGKIDVTYEYDMGDSWEHDIVLIGTADRATRQGMDVPDEQKVVCISGEGHPCAEDCGGTPGWEELKELFTKKNKRDYDDRRDWYKTVCLNGDPRGLNPWEWSIMDVNTGLLAIQ